MTPRKVGRPARIDRDRIAQAAGEIGLGAITVKAVADRLGVSVAGLYHHIDGKDDLLRLAADHTATRVRRPVDTGQHWALWLVEWAVYNRTVFVDEPALLAQYLDGAVQVEAIAESTDAIYGALVERGFPVRAAADAFQLVSAYAIGAAVNQRRDRRAELALFEERDAAELPHLRALARASGTHGPPSFHQQLRLALLGIAVERGFDPAEVDRVMRRPSTRALTRP